MHDLTSILHLHMLWIDNPTTGSRAGLADADLRDADLRDADLRWADLRGADLWRANLWRANLRRANLTGANLGRANLWRANLTGAELGGADLTYADLTGADLSGAELGGADLTYADLTGADLERADLERAIGLPNAPCIPHIDAAILAHINDVCKLEMRAWCSEHECKTTYCRGGFAILLAGDAGIELERKSTSYLAARLIYEASRPHIPCPNFFASNEDAMADLIACAKIDPLPV